MSEWKAAWRPVAQEVQFAAWKKALEAAGGNISQAARDMGLQADRGMVLTRMFKLNQFAGELRLRAWGRKYGRPPG